jgi:hypothetical protein
LLLASKDEKTTIHDGYVVHKIRQRTQHRLRIATAKLGDGFMVVRYPEYAYNHRYCKYKAPHSAGDPRIRLHLQHPVVKGALDQ